jgi:hypothetical protein
MYWYKPSVLSHNQLRLIHSYLSSYVVTIHWLYLCAKQTSLLYTRGIKATENKSVFLAIKVAILTVEMMISKVEISRWRRILGLKVEFGFLCMVQICLHSCLLQSEKYQWSSDLKSLFDIHIEQDVGRHCCSYSGRQILHGRLYQSSKLNT